MRRPIEPGDFDAVARLIEQVNEQPSARDLHTWETPVPALVRQMRDLADAGRLTGLIETETEDLIGAALFETDAQAGRAWLWGPAGRDIGKLLDRALELLPVQIKRVSCFFAAENMDFRAILTARGARFRPVTHIYRAGPPLSLGPIAKGIRRAGPTDRDALHVLHEAEFPASYRSADGLLALDPARALLLIAERDGSLAGYVAATIQEDDTGYIDYLATGSAVRGQGIATSLLAEAMRWLFEQRHMPSAHLTVRDDKSTARHLYERAGFHLHASGIPADLTIIR